MATKFGTLGQFIVVTSADCAVVPDGVDPDDAATLGCAAGTALQSLPPDIVKPGSKIFVNGGSGGVGTYAIQFAKIMDAEVVASCSTPNVELCQQLGADEVLDYKTVDVLAKLREMGQIFDLVIDNAGSPVDLYTQSGAFLKASGIYVQIAATPTLSSIGRILGNKIFSMIPGGKRRTFQFVMVNETHDDYVRMGQWMGEKRVKAVIDQAFEFEDVPKAYEKLRTGRARGKILVHVGKNWGIRDVQMMDIFSRFR